MTTMFLFSKLKKSKAQTGNTILIVRKPKTPISKPTFQQQQRQTFTSIDSLSLTINRKLFFTLRKRKVSPLIQVHALNPKLLILQNTLTFFPIHLISLFYPGGAQQSFQHQSSCFFLITNQIITNPSIKKHRGCTQYDPVLQ